MSDPYRLRKLLLMLSSPYSGEITTAARAIGSQLAKDGHDWFWLADCVVNGPIQRTEQPKPQQQPMAGWDDWNACDIAQALAETDDPQITAWEADFLQNVALWDGPATAKQDAILRRIAAKIGWRP